jgi:hypothetical protein
MPSIKIQEKLPQLNYKLKVYLIQRVRSHHSTQALCTVHQRVLQAFRHADDYRRQDDYHRLESEVRARFAGLSVRPERWHRR